MILEFRCEEHKRIFSTDVEPAETPKCGVCGQPMKRADVSPKALIIEGDIKNGKK